MVSGQRSAVSKLKFWIFFVFMASVILPESVRGEVIDRVAAVVNGEVVTLSEIAEREGPLVKQAEETFSGAERDKRLSEIRKKVLDSLIEDLLLEQEAEKLGLKVSDRDVDDAIEDVKKQNSLDDEGLKAALKKEGLTYEAYRVQIKKQIEKSRVIGQQVRSKVSVSEKDLADYYERNQRMFLKDEEVRISHILFVVPEGVSGAAVEGIRKEAMVVLEMARSGADFQELAKKYSEDSSARDGGTLGSFKRGQILPAFEKAAFSLRKGEISDLVRTTYGFHIIKVDDVKEASLEPFESVKEKIRSALTSETMELKYKEWMEELKKSALIEVKL